MDQDVKAVIISLKTKTHSVKDMALDWIEFVNVIAGTVDDERETFPRRTADVAAELRRPTSLRHHVTFQPMGQTILSGYGRVSHFHPSRHTGPSPAILFSRLISF